MVARARAAAVLVGVLVALIGGAAHASAPSVTAIALGEMHACGVYSDGSLRCWGRNNFGQLGDGTQTNRLAPTPVTGLGSGVAAVALGLNHTCALTAAGAVRCWGYNGNGQLGNSSIVQSFVPQDVVGLGNGIEAIAAGGDHTCALKGGVVRCWGRNLAGALGDGTTTDRTAPVTVQGVAGALAIYAGGSSSCALVAGGKLDCWGANSTGQLGDGSETDHTTFSQAFGFWSKAAMGNVTTCAIDSLFGNGVSCWGDGTGGALGNGTSSGHTTSGVPVSGLGSSAGIKQLGLGYGYACVLTTGGGVKCWGGNGWGQLGDGTTTLRTTPVDVSGLSSGVQAIAVGVQSACAVVDGGIKCWGRNDLGQLGNGTTDSPSTPVATSTNRTLTVSKAGGGAGAVTSTPSGINCGASCADTYVVGATVTLTAVASAGSTFTGWSGDCSGTATTCNLTIDANRNVTATFSLPNAPPATTTKTTTVTTTTTTPATATTGAAQACVVPNVRKKTQAAATALIAKTGCTLATVLRGYSKTVKKGWVYRQVPLPGALPKKPFVTIFVSRGKKKH